MRLIDIDELRGCAIIRPMSHEEMSHILSCRNLLIHDEIPTAYNKKHDKEIRDKAIEEFIHRTDKECGFYKGDNKNLSREMLLKIAEQMKEVGE